MLGEGGSKMSNISGERLNSLQEIWKEMVEFPIWDASAALEFFLGELCAILNAREASWLTMRKLSKLPREIPNDHYGTIFNIMQGWSPMAAEYTNPDKKFEKMFERWLMHARHGGVDPLSERLLEGAGKYTRAYTRHDVATDQEWENHWISKKFLGFYQIGERITGTTPLSAKCEISVIIDRPLGADPFTSEDRDFLSVAIASVPNLQKRLCLERGLLGTKSMLSNRETETYKLLLSDLSESEIAERLKLSTHTVHDYARQLYRKFDVKGRVGLMAKVLGCS
jgi:DNA-binding CsgD family transcriptional regulator